MYQTVGHDVIDLYAEAIGIPLFRKVIAGRAVNTDLQYLQIEDDEVEDLTLLLKSVQVFSHFLLLHLSLNKVFLSEPYFAICNFSRIFERTKECF